MTLINRILRVIPKKHVDLDELDRKNNSSKMEPTQTIKRDVIKPSITDSDDDISQETGMINGEYEIIEREIMPEKIICPDCGGITLEGLEYCDKCGGDLTNY